MFPTQLDSGGPVMSRTSLKLFRVVGIAWLIAAVPVLGPEPSGVAEGSADGGVATRPQLTNGPCGEHATTNIIFDGTDGVSAYSSILVDPSNREWPYEMFVLRESWGAVKGKPPEGNGYYRYRSRDGRAWERVGGKVAGPMTGDLCFFYRVGTGVTPFPLAPQAATPEDRFVAYYRLGSPRQPTDH